MKSVTKRDIIKKKIEFKKIVNGESEAEGEITYFDEMYTINFFKFSNEELKKCFSKNYKNVLKIIKRGSKTSNNLRY